MRVLWSLARKGTVWSLCLLACGSAQCQTSGYQAPGDTSVYTARAAIVDPLQGKMGVYRSLAQLADEAYVEKQDAKAAVLAQILEKVWDRGETGLRTSSPGLWGKIDKSMDAFIKPLIAAGTHQGHANEAVISTTYLQYLSNLTAAD